MTLSLWVFSSAPSYRHAVPGGSEVVLAALGHGHQYGPGTLLGWGDAGQYARRHEHLATRWLLARRYPLDQPRQAKQQRAIAHLKKWGSPLLRCRGSRSSAIPCASRRCCA